MAVSPNERRHLYFFWQQWTRRWVLAMDRWEEDHPCTPGAGVRCGGVRCGGVRCGGVRWGGEVWWSEVWGCEVWRSEVWGCEVWWTEVWGCGGVRCGGVRCGTGVDRLLANQKTLIYIFFWITDQFTRIYIYVCFFFSFLWSWRDSNFAVRTGIS